MKIILVSSKYFIFKINAICMPFLCMNCAHICFLLISENSINNHARQLLQHDEATIYLPIYIFSD